MGIFNQHSNNQPQQQQRFLRGLQGSPGIGFSLTKDGNYDMLNKKLKNVGEGVESNDAITKHQLEVSMNTKLNKTSLSNYVKKNSPEVGADLDMKGYAIKNMKITPGNDASATSKKYVDRKVATKADKNGLSDYLKLDGTKQMQANLKINNKRINGLTNVPVFVYFTIHYDDKVGDLNTYPKEFKNQIYLVAYGVEGLTDHVDSEVYDAHEAFEIDKTKMKMLVPLDMSNTKILNTNFDFKFGDIFKIIKCYFKTRQGFRTLLYKKRDNQILSFSTPVVLHANIYR